MNSGGGTPCTQLLAAATLGGGAAPANVLGALVNVVRHPGTNVGALFNLVGSTPPYPTTLTAAPHDWTMSLNVTGGGLADPTELALDRYGNVWVTNYGNPGIAGLIAYSPQGTPFAGSPFGVGLQTEAYGMALDRNGDAWVASRANRTNGAAVGSVAKFLGASSGTPGALAGLFQDQSIQYPSAIATDPAGSGSVLIVNYNHGSVTYYDLNGNFQKSVGQNAVSYPVSVTSDNAGGAWVGNYDHFVTHILADGSAQNYVCCNVLESVKLDQFSNVWISNYNAIGVQQIYTFSEVSPGGAVLINEQSGGGLNSPSGSAVDAAGQFWVANVNSTGSFTEVAGNASATPGAFLSPSNGFGLDAGLSGAFTIAPDQSGNLWVSSRFNNKVVMFFGMATPTRTPATPLTQAP